MFKRKPENFTAKEIGNIGEKHAARFLRKNGYRIKAANIYIGHVDIDILCENREYIVFAEVKTRVCDENGDAKRPSEAVDAEKQRHMFLAASAYLRLHPSKKIPRLDVLEVYLSSARPRRLAPLKVTPTRPRGESIMHIKGAVGNIYGGVH